MNYIITETQYRNVFNKLDESNEELTFQMFNRDLKRFVDSILENPSCKDIPDIFAMRGFTSNSLIKTLLKWGVIDKKSEIVDDAKLRISFSVKDYSIDKILNLFHAFEKITYNIKECEGGDAIGGATGCEGSSGAFYAPLGTISRKSAKSKGKSLYPFTVGIGEK